MMQVPTLKVCERERLEQAMLEQAVWSHNQVLDGEGLYPLYYYYNGHQRSGAPYKDRIIPGKGGHSG